MYIVIGVFQLISKFRNLPFGWRKISKSLVQHILLSVLKNRWHSLILKQLWFLVSLANLTTSNYFNLYFLLFNKSAFVQFICLSTTESFRRFIYLQILLRAWRSAGLTFPYTNQPDSLRTARVIIWASLSITIVQTHSRQLRLGPHIKIYMLGSSVNNHQNNLFCSKKSTRKRTNEFLKKKRYLLNKIKRTAYLKKCTKSF